MSPASRFIRCINSRAVVDLPQPDSPTIPTVSPLTMEKETSSTARTVLRGLNRSPRTGKCLVRPVTCSSGCAAPPTSATGSSSSTDGLVSLIRQFLMSMALRMPSLSKLKQIDTAKIMTPGNAATHGLT